MSIRHNGASEAKVLSGYFELKRYKPPGFLAVYLPGSDGDFHRVAVVDMAWEEESLRMMGAVVRACRETPVVVGMADAEGFDILEAEGAEQALSPVEWRWLYRQYYARHDAFTRQDKRPVFSQKYRELHARAFGD